MDDIASFYCAQPNKTLGTRESLWAKNFEGPSHNIHGQALVKIYKSPCLRCFGRWLPNNYVWWFGKPNGWDDIIIIWELDNEPQCTFQNLKNKRYSKTKTSLWTILLLLPLSILVGVNHLVFKPCNRGIRVAFLPPNITSVVQPLNQGIIASFKVQCVKKLMQCVLSQFDSSTTYSPWLEECSA